MSNSTQPENSSAEEFKEMLELMEKLYTDQAASLKHSHTEKWAHIHFESYEKEINPAEKPDEKIKWGLDWESDPLIKKFNKKIGKEVTEFLTKEEFEKALWELKYGCIGKMKSYFKRLYRNLRPSVAFDSSTLERPCLFCRKDHSSVSCHMYLNNNDRWSFVSDVLLCPFCLQMGCRGDCGKRCSICFRRWRERNFHHAALCDASTEFIRVMTVMNLLNISP